MWYCEVGCGLVLTPLRTRMTVPMSRIITAYGVSVSVSVSVRVRVRVNVRVNFRVTVRVSLFRGEGYC